jgi:hypothetical protein
MLDHTHTPEWQEAPEIADKILERVVFGSVLFALVVFGMVKGLLG